MASTDDSDIPENGAVFTFGKSQFADNVPNKFWVKNDKVVQVVCGDEHTALITESGRIFVFGSNSMGQLGLPEVKAANKPSCIKSLKTEKCKLVACGRYHTVVATESGKLYSFGANNEGQLGVEDIADSHTPLHIKSQESTPFSMLEAGADHSVALAEDGRVFVWGGGGEGQLGLGHDSEVHNPRELRFDENIVCIACGYYHTALVTENGDLYTFGETEGGKLGLGENPAEYDIPQHVSSITEKVKWVACGGSHTVVLTASGKVYTFGEGANGQLGHGTLVLQSSVPHLLKVNFKVSKIACGENITAIISDRGQLYTFGDGRHGKLAQGQESFCNQFMPQRVNRFAKFLVEKAACGGCHMIVTAHKRVENGDIESEEEMEDASQTLGQSLKGLDLNGSVPARVRRRQTMSGTHMDLNRTLPSLGNNRTLPVLNGHATLPARKNQENLLQKSMLPGIQVHADDKKKKKKKKGDSEEESEEEEEEPKGKKIAPQPLPRGSPKGKPPQPKESESEDEGLADSEGEAERGAEKHREEGDQWSSEGEKEGTKQNGVKEEDEEDELSEEEKDEAQPRSLPGPVPTPRKKIEEKNDTEEEEDKDEEEKKGKKGKKDKKKDKDKKKKKKGFFGKKGAVSDEEEADDEEDEEKDEEKKEEEVKGKKKKKDKKDKKKDKVKGKKDKDEEEEEEDEEEEEEAKVDKDDKKKGKKDKKKDKGKKDKKKKNDKKDEDEDETEEKGDETEEKDGNANEQDKKDDATEEKEEVKPPPKKKSRFCTIL